MTVTDSDTSTGTASFTVTPDTAAPTGQTVALGGGPWFTSASVPLTIGAGTDAGAGVDATRGVVERAAATLTNGSCGTFGAFSAVTLVRRRRYECHQRQLLPLPVQGHGQRRQRLDRLGCLLRRQGGHERSDHADSALQRLLERGRRRYDRLLRREERQLHPDRRLRRPRIRNRLVRVSGDRGLHRRSGPGQARTYTFTGTTTAPSAPQSVTATNGGGLTSAPASFTLVADPTAPTVDVLCNGKPCVGSPYAKAGHRDGHRD